MGSSPQSSGRQPIKVIMKPTVANNKPIPVDLDAGEEYYFCTCGKSANQPFCDGSHKGTNFAPKPFVAEETGEAYLCQCKQSLAHCFWIPTKSA